ISQSCLAVRRVTTQTGCIDSCRELRCIHRCLWPLLARISNRSVLTSILHCNLAFLFVTLRKLLLLFSSQDANLNNSKRCCISCCSLEVHLFLLGFN
ncbi:hypothetical protein X975_15060, partial [Stegodyphus mimosarum]